MTEVIDCAAGLRRWLIDYLIDNIGCSPDDIETDVPMNDLGVGSIDAVVLSGELSELFGRAVSPVEFWEPPTTDRNWPPDFGHQAGGTPAGVRRSNSRRPDPIGLSGRRTSRRSSAPTGLEPPGMNTGVPRVAG